jgi:hypothetical protein
MPQYLHAWGEDDDEFNLETSAQEYSGVARPRGRSSQLIPADPRGPDAELGLSGVILFLVPLRAAQLMATLTNDLGEQIRAHTFITHGHASAVLILETEAEAEGLLVQLAAQLAGWEAWPHRNGRVQRADVRHHLPQPRDGWSGIDPVDASGLGFEAAAQIRQFNANIALLSRVVAAYAPEVRPLVEWLYESIGQLASDLRDLAGPDEAERDARVRQAIGRESTLVEANAVITLYTSQLGSGTLPLALGSSFPVGEYSLLGIGAMCRAAWRIYAHLNETFGRFDHVGIVQRRYSLAGTFDPWQPSKRANYDGWRSGGDRLNIARLSDHAPEGFRYHIPYFSSRWGFHESLHSISLSWQCLYASASKEWNLLTVTHEFLHAHVRDLLNEILDPTGPEFDEDLCRRFNEREAGSSTLQCMQMAYVEALVGLRGATRLARKVTDHSAGALDAPIPDDLTPDILHDLVRGHSGLVHELVVHVLDFYYVYAGRDNEYINSVWSSWSLVPTVMDHIEHYVLRTLATLASRSDHQESGPVFSDAVGRLRESLLQIRDRTRSRPVIRQALELLDTDITRKRLEVLFRGARYIVELTRVFFLDAELNADLVRDDLTTVLDGRRTYSAEVGVFSGDAIHSPIGFLLDRFPTYSDQAGSSEAEYESIWQMLSLT